MTTATPTPVHPAPDPAILPSLAAVRAAAERVAPHVPRSRLVAAPAELSERVGVPVWFKMELENPTGSFKVRGAFNALATLPPEEWARGVVCSSAGNHGLGVAYAARTLGIPATVYVPVTAPEVKKAGIRALGATVNDEAADYDVAMVVAKAHAAREGIRFINPCLGLPLLAGQGTVALELLEELPAMGSVVICTGGGGLLGGMGAVLRALAPGVRIIGAQSVETAAMTKSLAAGRVVEVPVTPTLADGLSGQIDEDALHIGQVCADRMALVTEEQLGETIAWLHHATGVVTEGAGAVTVAALRHGLVAAPPGPVVALVSGRNIDPARLETLVARFAPVPFPPVGGD